MRHLLCGLVISLLFPGVPAFAEERAHPFTPEQLLEQSKLAFKGTVLEVERSRKMKGPYDE